MLAKWRARTQGEKNAAVGYRFNMPYVFIHGQVFDTPLRSGLCADLKIKTHVAEERVTFFQT